MDEGPNKCKIASILHFFSKEKMREQTSKLGQNSNKKIKLLINTQKQ